MFEKRGRFYHLISFAIVGGCLLIANGLATVLEVGLRDVDNSSNNNNIAGIDNGDSPALHYKSATGIYDHVTVVADSKVSSEIGADILSRTRGNAVDAAVAAQFATCLVNAHSCGVGGGNFIVFYDSESGEWHAIDSKETAPAAATEDMFKGNIRASLFGGLASAVPGEVLGLWELHRRFGKLPWADVVNPSVALCENGVPLTQTLHNVLANTPATPKMKQDFAPYFDEDGNAKPTGSLIKLPKMAQTLRIIADDPASFYKGSLAQDIVDEVQSIGGIITMEDMKNYQVKWKKPTTFSLPGNYKLYSMPAPGSGPVLSYILNILAGYNMSPVDVATKDAKILTYHRIVEAFKFAYAERTKMGDDEFVDIAQLVKNMTSLAFGEATRARIDDSQTQTTQYYQPSADIVNDQGTSHISVIDGQGSAVAITSSINTYFGNKVKGSRTGIVLNNVMNDFSVPGTTNAFDLPASQANFIRPGKRPMSSMAPAIIWDEGEQKVRMVTGASGGSRITTAVAMNIIDVLWLGRSLPASIDRLRFHHQLVPTHLQLEKGFPKDIEEGLKAKGHATGEMPAQSVVQAIDIQDNGQIIGTADFRKGGEPMGF